MWHNFGFLSATPHRRRAVPSRANQIPDESGMPRKTLNPGQISFAREANIDNAGIPSRKRRPTPRIHHDCHPSGGPSPDLVSFLDPHHASALEFTDTCHCTLPHFHRAIFSILLLPRQALFYFRRKEIAKRTMACSGALHHPRAIYDAIGELPKSLPKS